MRDLLVAPHPVATSSFVARTDNARRGRSVGEEDELFYGGRQLGLAVRSTGCGAEAGEIKVPLSRPGGSDAVGATTTARPTAPTQSQPPETSTTLSQHQQQLLRLQQGQHQQLLLLLTNISNYFNTNIDNKHVRPHDSFLHPSSRHGGG